MVLSAESISIISLVPKVPPLEIFKFSPAVSSIPTANLAAPACEKVIATSPDVLSNCKVEVGIY